VDGCTTTKAPCGGQTAGPNPVDRRKQGLKRSMVTEASAIPLGAVPAPANHRDDDQPCRQVLAERGMVGPIATRGIQAPMGEWVRQAALVHRALQDRG
jgi:hypothetical protein